MATPEQQNIPFQRNRPRNVSFCEGCRKLQRVNDKRIAVKKGWRCSDCKMVKA